MKCKLAALFASFLLLIIPVSAAENFHRISGFTEDQLSVQQQQELENRCEEIFNESGMDIGVHITYDTGGKSSMVYADDYYDSHPFGREPDYNGAILLINMQDRELHISVCEDGGKYLTDSRIDKILDKLTSYVQKEDYYRLCSVFLDESSKYYSMKPMSGPGDVSEENSLIGSQSVIISGIAIALLIAGITVGIVAHSYTSLPKKPEYSFAQNASLHLSHKITHLIDVSRTSRKVPKETSSSSSRSSSGSSHRSSSGRTHSGGGRSF